MLDPTIIGAGPRVYTMTVRSQALTATYQDTRYSAKMTRVDQALRRALPKVPIFKYNYIRADNAALPIGVTGKALFQYDPDSDGNGSPGWRLFFEQNRFSNLDQVPTTSAQLRSIQQGIPAYQGP